MINDVLDAMIRLQKQALIGAIISAVLAVTGGVLTILFGGLWVVLCGISIGFGTSGMMMSSRIRAENNNFISRWSTEL